MGLMVKSLGNCWSLSISSLRQQQPGDSDAGLFSARETRTERLREVIVDLAAPAVKQPQVRDAATVSPAAEAAVQQSGLNAEQQDGVRRYFCAH